MSVNADARGWRRLLQRRRRRCVSSRGIACFTFCLVATVGCSPRPSAGEKLTLESGETVRVLQRKKWTFTDGSPPALQLVYETKVPIADSVGLLLEARQVWEAFVPEVEKAGFTAAALTPTQARGVPGVVHLTTSFGFVATRASSGIWVLR